MFNIEKQGFFYALIFFTQNFIYFALKSFVSPYIYPLGGFKS